MFSWSDLKFFVIQLYRLVLYLFVWEGFVIVCHNLVRLTSWILILFQSWPNLKACVSSRDIDNETLQKPISQTEYDYSELIFNFK